MDTERVLGRLEAQTKQLEKQLGEYNRHFDARFNRVEEKLDGLMAYRWKIAGAAAFAGVLVEIFIQIAKAGGL